MVLRTLVLLSGLVSVGVMAGVEDSWPISGINAKADHVVNAYQAQCAEWAGENDLKGDEKEGYLKQCVADMAAIWPVGYGKVD